LADWIPSSLQGMPESDSRTAVQIIKEQKFRHLD